MSRYKDSPEYRELRCPCCGKPMQEMEVVDTCYGYDEDLYANYHFKYRCKECNIKFEEGEGWSVPKGYIATITLKQINYLDILYNGFSNRLYDYDETIEFDKYIPKVLSKEFATRLIQDKLDEQKAYTLKINKEKEYDELLYSYGVDIHYLFSGYANDDNHRSYGLPIKGGKIIFEVDINTYEVNTKQIRIEVDDLPTFKQLYNNKEAIDKLLNLKLDLIKLKEAHDKL